MYFSIFRLHLHIFAEPQIHYLIFDNFQYSLACKLNYISVFILNFFIIFLELTIYSNNLFNNKVIKLRFNGF